MKEVTFPVSIGAWNEIDVTLDVNEKDYRILKRQAEENAKDFCDCERLEKLYRKVCDAAYDEMANSVYDDQSFIEENLGGEYDFDAAREYIVDNYEIFPRWPDL